MSAGTKHWPKMAEFAKNVQGQKGTNGWQGQEKLLRNCFGTHGNKLDRLLARMVNFIFHTLDAIAPRSKVFYDFSSLGEKSTTLH